MFFLGDVDRTALQGDIDWVNSSLLFLAANLIEGESLAKYESMEMISYHRLE